MTRELMEYFVRSDRNSLLRWYLILSIEGIVKEA
jgi:hypothetical protein